MSRWMTHSARLGMLGLAIGTMSVSVGCQGMNLPGGLLSTLGSGRTTTAPASGSVTPSASGSVTPSPAPTGATPAPTASAPDSGLDVRTLGQAPNTWMPFAPMTTARQGLVAVDSGDRLFALTGDGTQTDEVYSYSTSSWQRFLSTTVGFQRNVYFAGAAIVGSNVALIDGMEGSEAGPMSVGVSLPIVDPMTQAPENPYFPSALLQLPNGAAVYSPGVATLNGQVYVAGGRDLSGTHAELWRFDTITPTPMPTPSPLPSNYQPTFPTATAVVQATMPQTRAGLGLAAVYGKLYAIGGYSMRDNTTGTVDAQNTVQVYDPGSNTWQVSGTAGGPQAMPTKRYGFGTAVLNNKIYVIGGKDDQNRTLKTVEAYDPATNTWSTLTPMPTARSILAVVVHQGKLYALGGADATGRATRVVEVYAP